VAACIAALATAGYAQSVREHTRLARSPDAVTESQEAELNLQVAPITQQLIQTWIRTAGTLDDSRKILTACVSSEEGQLVAVAQRVRSFPPDSKSSVYQARVTSVAPRGDCIAVEARLSGPIYGEASRYVMEIIVDRGMRLAVANAAIIERDGSQMVYVQLHPGHYDPRVIRTGIKGELYTEVLDGVSEGADVVTIGSFFVDAEFRLKMAPGQGMDAHHHH
jgi:hypothetical protein